MTQKEAKILVEIITKVVRKELGTFKRQLLQEGYSPQSRQQQYAPQPTNKLTEVHKNFRKDFKTTSITRVKPLSRDPSLNAILMECAPMPKEGSKEELEMLGHAYDADSGINLPTGEHGGLMPTNANVDHVLEAMNRDYSEMFKPKGSSSPSVKQQLRSDFMAIMESDLPVPRGGQGSVSAYPSVQPFSGEEEDMTWLNEVQ